MTEPSQSDLHREMRPGFLGAALQAVKYFGLTKAAALWLLLRAEERKFVSSAPNPQAKRQRAELLAQFKTIYRSILCLHFPFHFALVAKFLLGLDVKGPIVECGAFKGGSSAQLSLIARATGRKLYVCDSFQGLPAPTKSEAKVKIFNDTRTHTYQEGDYAATLEEIKGNIARYGAIEVCEFVPGFFNRSLPKLKVQPAAILLDVDLISSARDCLKSLWPRLKPGGYVFTHEAESETYMQGLMDKAWWKTHLKECPPLIFGAGSSLSPVAEGLALFRKA